MLYSLTVTISCALGATSYCEAYDQDQGTLRFGQYKTCCGAKLVVTRVMLLSTPVLSTKAYQWGAWLVRVLVQHLGSTL